MRFPRCRSGGNSRVVRSGGTTSDVPMLDNRDRRIQPGRLAEKFPLQITGPFEIANGVCKYRPRGKHSLVEAVDLVTRAISYCRSQHLERLLVDVTGLVEIPIPTLVDRFLMVEDWAQEAQGTVIVAMVAPSEYIHPRKFGVKVAAHFGLICDVYTSEEAASKWLLESGNPAGRIGE